MCAISFSSYGKSRVKKIPPYLLQNKWHTQPALHTLRHCGKLVYSSAYCSMILWKIGIRRDCTYCMLVVFTCSDDHLNKNRIVPEDDTEQFAE